MSLFGFCQEILKSFQNLTHSSDAILIFSSPNNLIQSSKEVVSVHNSDFIDIKELNLPPQKLSFIESIFNVGKTIIQNIDNTFLLAVNLDLPFHQQGALIIQRDEPFDDELLEFLGPLIGKTNHILSIKKLEENRSELDNMLSFFIQQVPVPVAMFDSNMCYKFASNAWVENFKLTNHKSLVGKSHYEVSPLQPNEWRERHQRALQGEIISTSAEEIINYFDEPIWLEGAIHPWYTLNGEIGGLIIYSNVVTDRKENEKNLKKTLENLIRSNQALEKFAHVCSHDLKEPLRSISNFITLLFGRNSEQFDDESLLYMRHILKGIDRMNILIKDILLYSKIAGQTNFEKASINVNYIIKDVMEIFESRISETGARFIIDVLPTISGNQTQIEQLFINLIDNALKFSSTVTPSIHIFVIESGLFWEFHVQDNGIGIPDEYHKSIFTMFNRLHSKNLYEGSGIGLATCQKIVHEHLGAIRVQSPPNVGSDFIFTLPKVVA